MARDVERPELRGLCGARQGLLAITRARSAVHAGSERASALDCLDLAPGRGFSSPRAAEHNDAGITDHGPRRRTNRCHPRLRGVQASQLPDKQEQAQQPRPDHACASTAAGVASTPATGRPVSAGALPWLVTVNVQSSAAHAAAARLFDGLRGRRDAAHVPAPRRRDVDADSTSARRGARRVERADLPGALEHASGDVDEFDAALIRGAGGVPVTADELSEGDVPLSETGADALEDEVEAETRPRLRTRCRRTAAASRAGRRRRRTWRRSRRRRRGRAPVGRAAARRQPRDRLPARELGRAPARTVARPPTGHAGDRASCSASSRSPASTSALADYVAKEIVEFILG